MNNEEFIIEIIDYIDNHSNEKLEIENIANHFHLDRYYLMKLFKKYINITIVYYINTKKIINSITQLINTEDSVLKISLDNYFSSSEYYCRQFKNILGISPIIFRNIFKNHNFEFSNDDNKLLELRNNMIDLNNIKRNILTYKGETSMSKELEKLVQSIDEQIKKIASKNGEDAEKILNKIHYNQKVRSFSDELIKKINDFIYYQFPTKELSEKEQEEFEKLSKKDKKIEINKYIEERANLNKAAMKEKIDYLEQALNIIEYNIKLEDYLEKKYKELTLEEYEECCNNYKKYIELKNKWLKEYKEQGDK